jgi:hypothetical protein
MEGTTVMRCVLLLLLSAASLSACATIARSLGRGGGCAEASMPAHDVQIAIDAIGLASPLGERLRALADGPLEPDSIRARVRLIKDEQVCRAAGATAQEWRARDRYEVFRIGRLYWVRGSSWGYSNALDDRFERIESFIDQ